MTGLAMLLAGVLAAAAPAPAPPKPTLDDCDARVRDHPKELSSYICYWITARRLQAWDDAARRLDARLALEPNNHLAQLYLGLIEAEKWHPRAKTLLESAAAGLAEEKNYTPEVYAYLSVAYYYQNQGNLPPADEALVHAQAAADASGDPMLLARLDHEQARQAFLKADYGRTWALVSKAYAAITPDAPIDLRTGVLGTLGSVCWALGRYTDSLSFYEKQAEMHHESGNLYLEAQSRCNIAVLANTLRGSEGVTVDDARNLARRALEVSIASGNEAMAAGARFLLAQDPALPLPTRIAYLDKVLAGTRDPARISEALRMQALLKLHADPGHPAAAMALADRALALARETGQPEGIAFSYVDKMNMRWETGPRDAAIADTLLALAQIERIRDLQRDELVRARWFARQSIYYYLAAGRILDASGSPPSPEGMELAFSIIERMRARALLDALDAAHLTVRHAATGPKVAERNATLEQLAQVQKKLASGGAPPKEKAELLREIDGLESKESALQDEIDRGDPRMEALKKPSIPSLAEVRALLPPDQAILAFQLSTRRLDDIFWWPNGGSWVFVITRDAVRVLPLPDFDILAKRVDVYVGTFARRDGLERTAGAGLYDDLLADAVAALPPGIKRLVVIPDRQLHRLPFDALAPSPDAPPLGERFEISIVPSATIWARWRRTPRTDVPESAWALADPAMPSGNAPATHRQAAPWVEGLRLGPLPQARNEARGLAKLLGKHCSLLEGAAASEHRLKLATPTDFGLLVLATHAVIDEEHPDRSAVLLAPGADEEDGLLQPREILDLPLQGRLVVLSSCSSASGTLLRGEGVVGLARAFFEAGARAVVASLWPMRDDEAAAVAGVFYRQLTRGASVSGALAAARRERMRAGAPAAEWAGLVVLGDGDLAPFPNGVSPTSR